jgi:chondroitin-sulfate-ABC endolyase/exolyase
VKAIDGETIFMEREDAATGEWVMSVCTPDLGLTEKSYTTRQESQPILKEVLLQGLWEMASSIEGVELLWEEGATRLKVTCRHGRPVDLRLKAK